MENKTMEAGDIGIIDHPISDAGVIARIERVTASRVSVCYFGKEGIWAKPQTRKVRRWHKISDTSNLADISTELQRAFLDMMNDKKAAAEKHKKRIAELAATGA